MAGVKSLVVLCFLLIIAASQAASCKYSACYWACRKLNLSKAFCAKKCHCSLPSTFFPNELATKEAVLEEMMMMEELSLNDCPTCNVEMTEAMTAEEMEVDYNLAEAVLEEMMMEELSLNESPTFVEEMTEAPKATEMEDDYNLAEAVLEEMMMMEEPSLNECPTCKVKVTEALAAAEMAVNYNRAEAILEKMTMEELTSMNDKLVAKSKCKYNPCYRACRALGGSKDFCAKKCRCTQATDMVPAVSPLSRDMAFKLIILAVALVSVIIGIILFPRKKAILISYFIKIWNFIGIISFLLKKENKRQEDEKDNKKEVNEEKQSLLPASGTAQEDQGQRSIHGDPHKRLDLQPLVDSEASIAEEDGTLVPASTVEEDGTLVPASLPE